MEAFKKQAKRMTLRSCEANKPKGLKVTKEVQMSIGLIGLMVNSLYG